MKQNRGITVILVRMSYGFVVALSQRRQAEWERVFGTDRLPVLDVRPRLAELHDGPAFVYDVALHRLHPGQVDRWVGYLARRMRVGYADARTMVERHGLTIRAEGVEVVTADVRNGIGRFALRFNATTRSAGLSGARL